MLSMLFKSHLIRNSGTGRGFKDTQRALEHLRHSESTRVLREHSGTWALGPSKRSGTPTLKSYIMYEKIFLMQR